jgi:hypothetical protein
MKIIKTCFFPPTRNQLTILVATGCLVATALAEPMFALVIQKPERLAPPNAEKVSVRFSLEGESLVDEGQ